MLPSQRSTSICTKGMRYALRAITISDEAAALPNLTDIFTSKLLQHRGGILSIYSHEAVAQHSWQSIKHVHVQ